MADGNQYPSVFVVDSYAKGPPRLGPVRLRSNAEQRLLFLLVGLVLFAITVQGWYIYRLYRSQPADLQTPAKLVSDGDIFESNEALLPSKPMAHLTDGQVVKHGRNIMAWATWALPYRMNHSKERLYVEDEGYYFVYSKVYFKVGNVFTHSVQLASTRIKSYITLLENHEDSIESEQDVRSNSYLGGVFHLYKGDALFVSVSSTKQIRRGKPCWNVFGAYMI